MDHELAIRRNGRADGLERMAPMAHAALTLRMKSLRIFLFIACAGAMRCWAADPCPAPADANSRPTFDALQLKEGRFTYRTTLRGEPLGDTVIEIRRVDPTVRITMNAPKIGQSWEASVRRSFEPLSAHLRMQSRGTPYEMTLAYDGDKISGEERKGDTATSVSATAAGVVIDQRVDWASIMALTATSGSSIAVRVFDPSTGFSAMLGLVGETHSMTGAWGTTDAVRLDYRICKRERVENYTVFATATPPRVMLREDMPNGLVSELIRSDP